jgi:hypothetical protein
MNFPPEMPETAQPASDRALRAGWDAFCAGLYAAGRDTIAAGSSVSEAADGLLQFGLLIEAALRWYLRGADPDFPRFIEINDTPEVADNLFAAVRGDATYKIVGNVSTLFDINLSVHSSWVWVKPSLPTGDVGLRDLQIGEDGSVEIILGGEPRPGNWIALPDDAQFVQLREYHADFDSHRPGQWDISRVGGAGQSSPRPTVEALAARFSSALEWARRYGSFHRASIRSGRTFPDAPNTMRQPAPNKGGNRHIWYGFGRYSLKRGEGLILEFQRPEARLWSVQWLTDPWYENPDLLTRLTGLTGAEAHVNRDGIVRVIFAEEDPGVPNWLDVQDYPDGLFVTRWIWCAEGPPTRLTVVPLTELGKGLPPDTPKVTQMERAEQIARRRRHFVHRRR